MGIMRKDIDNGTILLYDNPMNNTDSNNYVVVIVLSIVVAYVTSNVWLGLLVMVCGLMAIDN